MARQTGSIRCDNAPEYFSEELGAWAAKHQIRHNVIQPGNPHQNAYIERYNRTVRYDWLAQYLFESIAACQWPLAPLSKIMRLNGSGTTITSDLIWGLVALPLNKN